MLVKATYNGNNLYETQQVAGHGGIIFKGIVNISDKIGDVVTVDTANISGDPRRGYSYRIPTQENNA